MLNALGSSITACGMLMLSALGDSGASSKLVRDLLLSRTAVPPSPSLGALGMLGVSSGHNSTPGYSGASPELARDLLLLFTAVPPSPPRSTSTPGDSGASS